MRRALCRQAVGSALGACRSVQLVGAVQQRANTQQAKPPPQPLSDEQLAALVARKREGTDNEAAGQLDVDEIYEVAELMVKCLSEEVALSATEMLVRRAEANAVVGLTVDQLVAFGSVIRGEFAVSGGNVTEAVLFDATWATFAGGPHGRMSADAVGKFCNVVWLGAVPEALKAELANNSVEYTKVAFTQKLRQLGVEKPSCKAREANMRQKTNWAKMVVQALVFLAIMQASKYGLIDQAMQNSPLQR